MLVRNFLCRLPQNPEPFTIPQAADPGNCLASWWLVGAAGLTLVWYVSEVKLGNVKSQISQLNID